MICKNAKCSVDHDGTYGSGKYCSRSCSNTRVRTKEHREKISNGVLSSDRFKKSMRERYTDPHKMQSFIDKQLQTKKVNSLKYLDKSIASYERKSIIIGNTKNKGDVGVAVVIAEFMKRGHKVSIPFGDNAPYDLIIDYDGQLKTVQVKSRGREKNGTILVPIKQSKNHISKETHHYGLLNIDWILLVDLVDFNIYKIENETMRTRESGLSLRLLVPKNGCSDGVHWAKDYLMFK